MRTRRTSQLTLTAGLVVVAIASVIPSGAFAMTDLRSPDAREAAYASAASAAQDLRSPDARDAATLSVHRIVVADDSPSQTAHSVATTPSASDGFDWGDAGLGAVAVLALAAAAGGAALLLARGRQSTRTT